MFVSTCVVKKKAPNVISNINKSELFKTSLSNYIGISKQKSRNLSIKINLSISNSVTTR